MFNQVFYFVDCGMHVAFFFWCFPRTNFPCSLVFLAPFKEKIFFSENYFHCVPLKQKFNIDIKFSFSQS